VDYKYNFNMSRFGILDHLLLSDITFDKSVISHHVIHDVDNFSYHGRLKMHAACCTKYVLTKHRSPHFVVSLSGLVITDPP